MFLGPKWVIFCTVLRWCVVCHRFCPQESPMLSCGMLLSFQSWHLVLMVLVPELSSGNWISELILVWWVIYCWHWSLPSKIRSSKHLLQTLACPASGVFYLFVGGCGFHQDFSLLCWFIFGCWKSFQHIVWFNYTIAFITVHRQAILLLVVESRTQKFRCLSVECLFVESETYYVVCQFCTVKGMIVESEVLKSQIALCAN